MASLLVEASATWRVNPWRCYSPLMPIVTVFRSRLRPGSEDEYQRVAGEMSALVRRMDGFLEEGHFTSPEGERVTIVRFADWQSQRAWAEHPEHVKAQVRGRAEFYSWYDISVSEETYHHTFAPLQRAPSEETDSTSASESKGATRAGHDAPPR